MAALSTLLAAFALVLHGAQPVLAMARLGSGPATSAAHADCPGHASSAPHATAHHDHAPHHAASTPVETERMPAQSHRIDCCTAVAAAVLSPADPFAMPEFMMARFALQPSFVLEGLPPMAPSEPPRPTDQV